MARNRDFQSFIYIDEYVIVFVLIKKALFSQRFLKFGKNLFVCVIIDDSF
jgi:hypothetical protein